MRKSAVGTAILAVHGIQNREIGTNLTPEHVLRVHSKRYINGMIEVASL